MGSRSTCHVGKPPHQATHRSVGAIAILWVSARYNFDWSRQFERPLDPDRARAAAKTREVARQPAQRSQRMPCALASTCPSRDPTPPAMNKPLVLMDHDGAVDDYLAALLLMTMDHLQPIGIVVTPADCYIEAAVSITRKILDLLGRSDVPVAESTVRGINAFPQLYRRDSLVIDCFPILNEQDTLQTPLLAETGQAFMVRALRAAAAPVTILETGPLTTVAAALDLAPDIEAKIERIVWMGGALNVRGNVAIDLEPAQDGSAEWNAYWDAVAIERVWQTHIPIVMCPLDITNTVPVTPQFIRRLAKQRRHPVSDLAGQCYSLVIPQDYYFWDVLATSYLAHPEFFELKEWETTIITRGRSQGRTQVKAGGRKVQALDRVDVDRFYEYILQQWAR